jgi:hypothetical protein
VVLRRYAAGRSTISDFLHQEVRALGGGLDAAHAVLQRKLTALFDRLVAEVSEAYRRADSGTLSSPHPRRLERIRRLLVGDLVDPAGLEYPLGGFHIAVIASGAEPERAARALATRLRLRLLIAESESQRCAAWLGGAKAPEASDLKTAAEAVANLGPRLSLGEPGEGLEGWRRSRRQAEAAHLVAERDHAVVVHYRDIVLVAAALRDPDLLLLLDETYIAPLRDDRPPLRRR